MLIVLFKNFTYNAHTESKTFTYFYINLNTDIVIFHANLSMWNIGIEHKIIFRK